MYTQGKIAKYQVLGFDDFVLRTLELSTGKVLAVDLTSSSSTFDGLLIHSESTKTYQPLGLQDLVQSSVMNIGGTLARMEGEGSSPRVGLDARMSRSSTEELNQELWTRLKMNGVDLELFTQQISAAVKRLNDQNSQASTQFDIEYQENKAAQRRVSGFHRQLEHLLSTDEGQVLEQAGVSELVVSGMSSVEKKRDAQAFVTKLARDLELINGNISTIDRLRSENLKGIAQARELLTQQIIDYMKRSDEIGSAQKSKKGVVVVPPINLSQTVARIEASAQRIQNSTIDLRQHRSETLTQSTHNNVARQQESFAHKQQLQQNTVRAEEAMRVRTETATRLSQTIAKVGLTNTKTFVTSNANAVILTQLLGLLLQFSDEGIFPSQMEGMNLDQLNQNLDELERRHSTALDSLSQVNQDYAKRCLSTDSYRWDLREGRPFNLQTNQFDDSLNACFSDSAAVSMISALNKGTSTVSTLVGISPALAPLKLVLSFGLQAAKLLPVLYNAIHPEVLTPPKEDASVPEAIHFMADLSCAASGSSECKAYNSVVMNSPPDSGYPPMKAASKLRYVDLFFSLAQKPRKILGFKACWPRSPKPCFRALFTQRTRSGKSPRTSGWRRGTPSS